MPRRNGTGPMGFGPLTEEAWDFVTRQMYQGLAWDWVLV